MYHQERSFLFVPGDRPERFEKAKMSGADAVIIDLEDAVLPENKIQARNNTLAYFNKGNNAFIRINSEETEWYPGDLALARHQNCAGVFLPKAESENKIYDLSVLMKAIYPIIESARGFRNIEAISLINQVKRLAFGTLDFSLDTGMADKAAVLVAVRTQIVLISRLAGLQPPLDGVTTDFKNHEVILQDAMHSREMGFGGKLCIHPSQIHPVNNVFSYSEDEIQWASDIIRLSETAQGAVSYQGKMIDRPVLEKARRILAKRHQ